MKRYITLICIMLILPFITLYSAPRKKVAVVLSGGGAKGVAHIGAIKVIEEMGIPVDYVVGTSIGAIVGGLYSIGYSPEQLDTIVSRTNWMELLTDKIPRKLIPFSYKADNDKYLISLPLKKSKDNTGLIRGKNISRLLHQLTDEYPGVICFDTLPIPFACVATDMVTNRREIIRSGNLADAMRASMAIPIVFTPVYSEGKVLIDGGFKDNLPIDVAKEMGADMIITVDVQSELAADDKLQSVPDVVNQLMLMICQSESGDKKMETDVYIKVDVTGYNAASFSKEALDTLIMRGENAAKANYSSLLSIKEKVGITDAGLKRMPLTFPEMIYSKDNAPQKENKLRVGLRFDTEDIAALLVNVDLQKLNVGEAQITLRGGKQSFIDTKYGIPITKMQKIAVANNFGYNDILLYDQGKKICNPTYIRNISGLSYKLNIINNLQFGAGVQLDYYHPINMLSVSEFIHFDNDRELFLNYWAELDYETLNKRYFPTKGADARIRYTLYTDCHSTAMYSALNARIRKIFSVTRSTALLPMIYGRFIFDPNISFIYGNMIGGEEYNRYFEQQLPFSGINYVEKVERIFAGVQLKIQQKIVKKQYLTLGGNYAVANNNFSRLFRGENIYGASIGYGYESPVGPIEAFFNYSNRTDHLGFYLNIGFGF